MEQLDLHKARFFFKQSWEQQSPKWRSEGRKDHCCSSGNSTGGEESDPVGAVTRARCSKSSLREHYCAGRRQDTAPGQQRNLLWACAGAGCHGLCSPGRIPQDAAEDWETPQPLPISSSPAWHCQRTVFLSGKGSRCRMKACR